MVWNAGRGWWRQRGNNNQLVFSNPTEDFYVTCSWPQQPAAHYLPGRDSAGGSALENICVVRNHPLGELLNASLEHLLQNR